MTRRSCLYCNVVRWLFVRRFFELSLHVVSNCAYHVGLQYSNRNNFFFFFFVGLSVDELFWLSDLVLHVFEYNTQSLMSSGDSTSIFYLQFLNE